jgi:hypothetical protein
LSQFPFRWTGLKSTGRKTAISSSYADVRIVNRIPSIGHGHRRKQAHDEHHDWICIHRGRCALCGITFTFLPLFSLPYTHYSLLARCHALQRRFVEHCSWEKALPKLLDSDRLPDPSTVRRWSSGLDCLQLVLSFLSQTVTRVAHWLARGRQALDRAELPTWITPALEVLWPMRV